MNKLLLAISLFFGATFAALADSDDGLQYVQNSFQDDADSKTGLEDSGMGSQKLSARIYFQQAGGKYLNDENGDPTNAALFIFIENLPLPEWENIVVDVDGGQARMPERKTINGQQCLIVHIRATEAGKKYNKLTVNHPTFGSAVIYSPTFKTEHIYSARFKNAQRVTINIDSDPSGATVLLDSKKQGVTPVTIENVTMGQHSVELIPANTNVAQELSEIITVDPAHTAFDFVIRRTKDVIVKATRPEAQIKVLDPSTQLQKAQGTGSVALDKLPYGSYKVVAYLNGDLVYDNNIDVNQTSPEVIEIKVSKLKSINFIAFQNNKEVSGATVTLNGEDIGETRLTKSLEYGKYRVTMTKNGQINKGGVKTLTVNDKTPQDFKLTLPPSYHYRSRWNPFDIDYTKRQWGFAFSYINKQYVYTVKPPKGEPGSTQHFKMDSWGQEDKYMHGMQMGIVFQPYFGCGQGLSTGIYWQYFLGDAPVEDDPTYHEHNLMIPLLYQFRLPVSETCSFFASAGAEMVVGLQNSIKWSEDENTDIGFGYNDTYDFQYPKRLQFYVPVGFGFQVKALQLEFRYSWGLTNNDDMYYEDSDGWSQSFKGRMMEASIQFVF